MSYLATLARPAETSMRVTTPHAAVPAAATLGEVHEEIAAARPHAAPAGPTSLADRSLEAAHAVPRETRAGVERPMAVEAPALPPFSPATGAERGIEVAPVVAAPRVAPARAQRPEPAIDMTSVREAASLPLPLATEPSPVARIDPHIEREHDTSAAERARASMRAASPLPVARVERDDESAARSATPPRARRDRLSVHIGAISLTVKAPAATPPPAAPLVAPVAQALAATAPARSREGLGFSASRHYLRWS